MSKPNLISLSVFYKNDQPEGFGFTLTNELADLENVLDVVTTSYRQMWYETENKDDLIADLIDQNKDISQHHKENHDGEEKLSKDDFKVIILAIGNVWLFERKR